MVEQHITLFDEEIESLNNFKEIEIFGDEDKDVKIFISLEDNKRNRQRADILFRYDNAEYWNEDIGDD